MLFFNYGRILNDVFVQSALCFVLVILADFSHVFNMGLTDSTNKLILIYTDIKTCYMSRININ